MCLLNVLWQELTFITKILYYLLIKGLECINKGFRIIYKNVEIYKKE